MHMMEERYDGACSKSMNPRGYSGKSRVRHVQPDETAIIVASHISSRSCCQHHLNHTFLTPARTCHLPRSEHPPMHFMRDTVFQYVMHAVLLYHSTCRSEPRGHTIHPWAFVNISYRTHDLFHLRYEMTIHNPVRIALPVSVHHEQATPLHAAVKS